jgi:hypothetical protein
MYIMQMKKYRRLLNGMGYRIDDLDLATQMIVGLPESMKDLKGNFLSSRELSPQILIATLINPLTFPHFSRQVIDSDEKFLLQSPKRKERRYCIFCKRDVFHKPESCLNNPRNRTKAKKKIWKPKGTFRSQDYPGKQPTRKVFKTAS